MAKYLVIVESPAKAKTIKKYLGKNYEVIASMGHVRDLPKTKLGVDIVAEYANSTSLDFVSEYEKRGFEDFLLKQYSNKDILSIFDNRARIHYSYMPTGFLYFVLSPIIEIFGVLILVVGFL